MTSTHRLYAAHVVKVPTANVVDVDLDLTFGVTLRRSIYIEGINQDIIRNRWKEATHCAVLLLGGMGVLVYVDPRDRTQQTIARIYVPSRMPTNPPVPLEKPPGLDTACVEVSSWLRWASDIGFDDRCFRVALKG